MYAWDRQTHTQIGTWECVVHNIELWCGESGKKVGLVFFTGVLIAMRKPQYQVER